MIRIVDYGVGNIQAFMTMFKRLGVPAERARTAAELGGLPGSSCPASARSITRWNC